MANDFTLPSGEVIGQLTEQGRNFLARSSLGLVAFTLAGFSTGRSGFDPNQVTNPLPLASNSTTATGTITLLDNDFATLTSVDINTTPFRCDVTGLSSPGTEWNKGATLEISTQNLTDAINNSTDINVKNVVSAIRAGTTITLTSTAIGAVGNTIVMETTFFDHVMLNGVPLVSPSNLSGGTDETMLDKIYPTANHPTTSSDIAEIPLVEQPTEETISAVCRLDLAEGNYAIGEIALWVQVIKSNLVSEVGKYFLYGKVHQPILVKTNRHIFVPRIITQY